MNFSSLSFLTLSATLILSSCAMNGEPDPMARGYIAFKEKYKSAPGPEARDIGYEFNTAKNNAVLEDMRYAAADLVSKLDQKLSFSEDKIYLIHKGNSAFYNSFDHLLRDELVKSGYMLSLTPTNAVPVTFSASEPKATANKISKKDYSSLHLSLSINSKNGTKDASSIGGVYEIPTYDLNSPSQTNNSSVPKETGAIK